MPDNMDDVSNFYISALATGFSTFTINIKFSDLFFDSIFNNGDYLLKYGCYILIQWNTRDNIIWGIDTFAAQAEIPSNTFIVEADNVINVSNICLQIDQQQNLYLIEQAEKENTVEKIITIPYIYEFSGSSANNILIFQLMNQSEHPQKLYKLYTALLFSSANPNYIPITNSNVYVYISDDQFINVPFQANFYNNAKLYIENNLYDDIYFDNINSQNMFL